MKEDEEEDGRVRWDWRREREFVNLPPGWSSISSFWARSERLSYSRRHVENGPFRGKGRGGGVGGGIHAKSNSIKSTQNSSIPLFTQLCPPIKLHPSPKREKKNPSCSPSPPSACRIRRHPSIWPKRTHLGGVPGSPGGPPPWLPSVRRRR